MEVMALMLFGLLSILLHEAAHLGAAWLFKIDVKRIGVSMKGIYIVRDPGPPQANLFITLAGPLANLLLACAWPAAHQFALANLIFGLTNLMPIAGSDGKRAWTLLYNGLNEEHRPNRARRGAPGARVVAPPPGCG